MNQPRTSVMTATVKVSTEGISVIDAARRRKGWSKSGQEWAHLATTSRSTLKRFWSGIAIKVETFKEICAAVGIDDWQTVADFVVDVPSKKAIDNQRNNKTTKKRLIIELDADFELIDPQELYAAIQQLSHMGNPVMKIVDVEEGSIKLTFEASSEDLERIQALIESGKMKKASDTPIKKVYFVENQNDVSDKNTTETLLERGLSLSDGPKQNESQLKKIRDIISRSAVKESSENPSEDLDVETDKQTESAFEYLRIVFPVIVQSFSILGGTTFGMFVLTLTASDEDWLSWNNWVFFIWDSYRINLIILSVLFVIIAVLLSIKSRAISFPTQIENPLLYTKDPYVYPKMTPLLSYFSCIERPDASAALIVILGSIIFIAVIQTLTVLFIGSLNGVELVWLFGENSLSLLNVLVAFSTGAILSVVILLTEFLLSQAILFVTFYVALFVTYLCLALAVIAISVYWLLVSIGSSVAQAEAEDIIPILLGLLGLMGMFSAIYWILLFVLFVLGIPTNFLV